MADEQREILQYQFQADISDLEAKSRRASELASGIDAKGKFTTPPVAGQAAAEATKRADDQAFAAWRAQAADEEKQQEELTRGTLAQANAVDTLVRNKRGLIAVVATLGGGFGGLAGHLISITSLIASAGKSLAGWIGAAAGVTLIVNLFRSVSEHAKQAADEQERLNDGLSRMQAGKLPGVSAMAEILQESGQIGRLPAAEALYNRVGEEFGADERRLAALATAAGVTSAEDVMVVRQAQLRRAGAGLSAAPLQTVSDFWRVLNEAREQGAYGDLLAEARAYAGTAVARETRAPFLMPGMAGPLDRGAARIMFDTLTKNQQLPPGTTFERFQQMFGARERMAAINELARSKPGIGPSLMAEYEQAQDDARRFGWLANWGRQIEVGPSGAAGAPSAGITLPPPDWLPQYERLLNQAFGFQPTTAEGRIGQTVVNIGQVQNISTAYQSDHGRRQRHNFDAKFGASSGGYDQRSPQ